MSLTLNPKPQTPNPKTLSPKPPESLGLLKELVLGYPTLLGGSWSVISKVTIRGLGFL